MAESLKIANVVRRFTFDEWGGTETVVWNTARELISLGHHPKIFCTAALSNPGLECIDNIDIIRFPYSYARLGLTSENSLRLDKKGGDPFSPQLEDAVMSYAPDLIHCHTMGRIGGLCRRTAAKLKIPYIVSLHGGYFDVPPEEIREMVRPMQGSFNVGRFLDLIINRPDFLAEADGIICVGYNEYQATSAKYPDKQVAYQPNGVDTERFNRLVSFDFRDKYGIGRETELLLCVSRIDYQKNQMLLIDLASKLKIEKENFHLVLIGPVTADTYLRKINDRIAAEKLDDFITIIPGLQHDSEELIAAYQTANIFILPSLHEPFGIVALEAWSAGVPLLGANTGGLVRLLDDGINAMVFDPNSLDSLIDAKARIQQSEEVTQAIIMNARKQVEEQYSWSKIAQQLEQFYKQLIRRKKD